MKVYNKLVRDKIPNIMKENGAIPVTRILNEEEYILELNKKLLEEVNEYLEDNNVLELADIEEIIRAILDAKNITMKEFQKLRIEKKKKRGAFKKRIFLEKEEDIRN